MPIGMIEFEVSVGIRVEEGCCGAFFYLAGIARQWLRPRQAIPLGFVPIQRPFMSGGGSRSLNLWGSKPAEDTTSFSPGPPGIPASLKAL